MAEVAVLTGTSSGVGSELARRMARDGWQLILLNRSRTRSAQLLEELGASVSLLVATDLADHRSIARAARKIAEATDRVDLLVNNAGVLLGSTEISRQGNEMHFEVNTLAPYQLIRCLHPQLIAAGGTVINVSSSAIGRTGRLRVSELQLPNDTRKLFGPYAQSKLALNTVSNALAAEYGPTGIKIRAVDPGPNRTPMTAGSGMPRILRALREVAFRPPRVGASKVLDAATNPRFQDATGVYIARGRIRRGPADTTDAGTQAALMALCRSSTGL